MNPTLWRCANPACPVGPDQFEAPTPVCPHCGADGRQHAALVVPLACIHYLAIAADGPIKTQFGNRMIACMTLRQRLPQHCTDARAAVTCPKCKASAIFQAHEEAGVVQHVPIVEQKLSAELGRPIEQTPGG